MSDSYERCGTIGFRCVFDIPLNVEAAALSGIVFPPLAFTVLNKPLDVVGNYVPAVAAMSASMGSVRDWAHWGTNGSGLSRTQTVTGYCTDTDTDIARGVWHLFQVCFAH